MNCRETDLPRFRAPFVLGSILLMGLVVASAVFAFAHFNAGMPTPSTQASIVKTTRVLQPTATIQSHLRISNASFSFTGCR